MYKLIAMYAQPKDPATFDKYYSEVHRPLAERIPGCTKLVLNRGIPAPWGAEPKYYLIAEMHFPDEQTFKTAMASPENAATGRDLRKFAADIVTLVTVREE